MPGRLKIRDARRSSRPTCRSAAAERLQDAEMLLWPVVFPSAIAMGVYSLEIHLKVLICKRLNLACVTEGI